MAEDRVVRVLGLMGSPRLGGNTDVLVSEALRGAAEAGARVLKIDLATKEIAPCTGCEACHQTGECVFDDDMTAVLSEMFASDVWILGTPVYWWGPTAQMKACIDRWYSGWQTPAGRAAMKKRVALISPYGDDDPATPRHIVGMLEDALAYLGAEFAAKLLVTAGDRGSVAENRSAMSDAYELGRRLASPSPVP